MSSERTHLVSWSHQKCWTQNQFKPMRAKGRLKWPISYQETVLETDHVSMPDLEWPMDDLMSEVEMVLRWNRSMSLTTLLMLWMLLDDRVLLRGDRELNNKKLIGYDFVFWRNISSKRTQINERHPVWVLYFRSLC